MAEARKWLDPKEPLIFVETTAEVQAYLLQILIWHELVDDWIGETPIRFWRFGDAQKQQHGQFDRQTESWWQQITGPLSEN
jgi:hypothetical protein